MGGACVGGTAVGNSAARVGVNIGVAVRITRGVDDRFTMTASVAVAVRRSSTAAINVAVCVLSGDKTSGSSIRTMR